jgi:hypothetical protein
MASLPLAVQSVILSFAPLFSKRVFDPARLLMVGAILAPGKRTVSAVLHVMGKSHVSQFQTYHRVLNRARWSTLQGSRILLMQLIEAFVPSGPIRMGVDETIERRWGPQIAARGIYRDPVRSSKSHVVKASGLRWVCLMLLVPVPWANRVWALPFLTVLAPSERYYQDRKRAGQTLLDRARQAIRLAKRWLPDRELRIVADNSYSALEWLATVSPWATVITRLRLDAALYESAEPREPGQTGRPRKKGKRLPTLAQVATDDQTSWQRVRVQRWYGQSPRDIEVSSETGVWYHAGKPVVPIRWVLIRDPQGNFGTQALLSTDLTLSALEIVLNFVERWQLEVTFEDARAHLGMETQRQWNERAIARTTPIVLALYSVVTLMARGLRASESIIVRQSTWYIKAHATFSDTIAWVRRYLWATVDFSMSSEKTDIVKIPRPLVERLIETVCYAA